MTTYHLRVFDEAVLFSGEVVRGFGRGARELGIPTANLDDASAGKVVAKITSAVLTAKDLEHVSSDSLDGSAIASNGTVQLTNGEQQLNGGSENDQDSWHGEECSGVYYGVGRIGTSKLYRAAISVGRNPHYGNLHCTCETHLIDISESANVEFYDQTIRCAILGKLRNQEKFSSLEALKVAIATDIERCRKLVDQTKLHQWATSDFFTSD